MTRILTKLALAALLCCTVLAGTGLAAAHQVAKTLPRVLVAGEDVEVREVSEITADIEALYVDLARKSVVLSAHSNWPFTHKGMAVINRTAHDLSELTEQLRALQAELSAAMAVAQAQVAPAPAPAPATVATCGADTKTDTDNNNTTDATTNTDNNTTDNNTTGNNTTDNNTDADAQVVAAAK